MPARWDRHLMGGLHLSDGGRHVDDCGCRPELGNGGFNPLTEAMSSSCICSSVPKVARSALHHASGSLLHMHC